MDVQLDVTEVNDFAAMMAKTPAGARRLAAIAVVETARAIRGTARSLAPKGSTRRLSRSIEATTPSGAQLDLRSSLSAEIGPTVFYAHIPEYGSSERAPHPYMGPAADTHEPDFNRKITEIAGAVLQ